jgi:hypothetical protein
MFRFQRNVYIVNTTTVKNNFNTSITFLKAHKQKDMHICNTNFEIQLDNHEDSQMGQCVNNKTINSNIKVILDTF